MAIVIDSLTKSYGEKLALPPFSATVEAGEIVCLLGQSGCGKTTLLRLLLGLETPTGGTVTGLPDRISAVFQEDRLCPAFSAVTNVSLALGRQASREEIVDLLTVLGLGDALAKPVRERIVENGIFICSGISVERRDDVLAALKDANFDVLDAPIQGEWCAMAARKLG